MAKSKAAQVQIPSARSADQPATRKMLALVRDELKSDIRGIEQKMESAFHKVDSRFSIMESRFGGMESRLSSLESSFRGLESRFSSMESRFGAMESRFSGLESGFNKMEAGNSRMQLLLEEQNANNRIVLEGLQTLWRRQDRLEERLR